VDVQQHGVAPIDAAQEHRLREAAELDALELAELERALGRRCSRTNPPETLRIPNAAYKWSCRVRTNSVCGVVVAEGIRERSQVKLAIGPPLVRLEGANRRRGVHRVESTPMGRASIGRSWQAAGLVTCSSSSGGHLRKAVMDLRLRQAGDLDDLPSGSPACDDSSALLRYAERPGQDLLHRGVRLATLCGCSHAYLEGLTQPSHDTVARRARHHLDQQLDRRVSIRASQPDGRNVSSGGAIRNVPLGCVGSTVLGSQRADSGLMDTSSGAGRGSRMASRTKLGKVSKLGDPLQWFSGSTLPDASRLGPNASES